MLLVLGFIIFSLMPSDPVEALTRGHPTSAKQIAFLVKQLGLNQPVWERFGHFVLNTLQGHLGYSWQFETPVATLILQRLWPTLLLMGSSTIVSVLIGMWLGIRSGWRPGSLLDRVSTGTAITFWSVPTFWLGHPAARAVQHRLRADPAAVPGGRHVHAGDRGRPGSGPHPRRRSAPGAAVPDAGAGRLRPVSDDHAVVDDRRDWATRTCSPPGPRACATPRSGSGTRCRTRCCRR